MAYERQPLAGPRHKRDILQHPVFVLVSKPDMAEFYLTARAVQPDGMRRRFYCNRLIQQLEDSFRRGHGRLQDVILLAYIGYRLVKGPGQLNKSDECADRRHISNYLPAAIPDDQGNADGADYFDRRIEYGVVKDRIYIGLPVGLVDLVEPAHLLVFAVKELNDLHSRYVLLEECIDPGDSDPDLAEGGSGAETEPGGQGAEQRQYRERNQRKAPVHL